MIIPQLLNPKLYLSKHNNKVQQENNQVADQTTTTTITIDDLSISLSLGDSSDGNYFCNKLRNEIESFTMFFQNLLLHKKDEHNSNIIIKQLKSIYSTIKEIGVYNSDYIINEKLGGSGNSSSSTSNQQPPQESYDLSYILELLFQHLLVYQITLESIDLNLWIFRIISLIISQDTEKVYSEILISMGLLNQFKKIKNDIIIKTSMELSSSSSSDDNVVGGSYNVYEKVKFIVDDIINQCNNFKCKFIFKKLYFNSFINITLRQLLFSDVGLGYKVWDSSLLLSEIIIQNQSMFNGKSALELGSGCGLSGIIASNYTNKLIVLSDYLDTLNDNIKFNIDQNININNNSNIQVIKLNWDDQSTTTTTDKQYDIVFGSDLIYTETASKTVPIILNNYLSINGIALLVLPECRQGINEFNNQLLSMNNNLKIISINQVQNLGDDGNLLVYLINKIK